MRHRSMLGPRLLLVAALVGGAVLAVPATAHAAGDHAKDLAECVITGLEDNGLAEDGTILDVDDAKDEQLKDFEGALEDCHKAKSLFTPALPELIWGGLAFLIVAFVLMKFAFPMIKKGLKAREDKIRGDLEGAEAARQEAEAEKARYLAQLAEARAEANRIVEEARAAAEPVRADVLARAEAEAAEIRSRAQEDIALARDRAYADLSQQVTELSIGLAERIVEHNLDRETQQALVESYISSVGRE
jgi:F-type H+-transporting ATPase subunit b